LGDEGKIVRIRSKVTNVIYSTQIDFTSDKIQKNKEESNCENKKFRCRFWSIFSFNADCKRGHADAGVAMSVER
jgi:hypothetical protein